MKKAEDAVYAKLSKWLKLQYPNMIWRFDYGAGMKISIGQAGRQKSLNPHIGYPDLFIAEMRGGFGGLYLEIKADGKSPYKKDGTIKADTHLCEQYVMLQGLKSRGYAADFAVGFDECVEKIKKYMELTIINQ